MKKYYVLLALIAVLSAGAIVATMSVSKDSVADKKTVEDLQELSREINEYGYQNRKLPATVEEVDPKGVDGKIQERIGNYSYKVVTADSYELCANFETSTIRKDSYRPPYDNYSVPSEHKAGRDCFTVKTDIPGQIDRFPSSSTPQPITN